MFEWLKGAAISLAVYGPFPIVGKNIALLAHDSSPEAGHCDPGGFHLYLCSLIFNVPSVVADTKL